MVSRALRRFALISLTFAMIVSGLGFLIYGAIYWWTLNGSHFGELAQISSINETCDLPKLLSLAEYTWILTLIVPGIAPAVCSIAIIQHTTPESCTRNRKAFISQVNDVRSTPHEWWQRERARMEWPRFGWEDTNEFKKWFRNRCDLPNTILSVFLAFFCYAVIVIVVVLIYIWTTPVST
jgi:hypothetical protein